MDERKKMYLKILLIVVMTALLAFTLFYAPVLDGDVNASNVTNDELAIKKIRDAMDTSFLGIFAYIPLVGIAVVVMIVISLVMGSFQPHIEFDDFGSYTPEPEPTQEQIPTIIPTIEVIKPQPVTERMSEEDEGPRYSHVKIIKKVKKEFK
jgi:hypothetical protein